MNSQQRRLHDELMKRFTADGKLIEAGWQSMRLPNPRLPFPWC